MWFSRVCRLNYREECHVFFRMQSQESFPRLTPCVSKQPKTVVRVRTYARVNSDGYKACGVAGCSLRHERRSAARSALLARPGAAEKRPGLPYAGQVLDKRPLAAYRHGVLPRSSGWSTGKRESRPRGRFFRERGRIALLMALRALWDEAGLGSTAGRRRPGFPAQSCIVEQSIYRQ